MQQAARPGTVAPRRDPGLFTHQGATWGWHTWEHSKGAPYPMTSESIEPLLAGIEHEATRRDLAHHAARGWDADRIDAAMARAAGKPVAPAGRPVAPAAWASEHGVRITCNEFGVYRQHADPEHRFAWLRDVVAACEKHGIGWTMWGYAGGFALVNRRDGVRSADRRTVEALGLSGPEELDRD